MLVLLQKFDEFYQVRGIFFLTISGFKDDELLLYYSLSWICAILIFMDSNVCILVLTWLE